MWTAPQRAAICGDTLLVALMESAPVADFDLERLLTNARFALLEDALAPTAGGGVERNLLAFHCLLARQCFTNDLLKMSTEVLA